MAIKPLTQEEIPPAKTYSNKLDLLANDIHEALANKVEYWEFIDFPYSPKTGIRDIVLHARKVLVRDLILATGTSVNPDRIPLMMYKRTDENGEIHIYGQFNYESWSRLKEEAWERANGRD